jgi:hypothetical protein
MALFVPTTDRNKLKHLVVAFTAGNLCFVRRWYDLERLQGVGMDYYRESPQNPNLLVGTLLASFLLTCIFYFGWRWATTGKEWRKRVAQSIFCLALAFPLESIRRYWNIERSRFDIGTNLTLLALEGMLVFGAILVWRNYLRIPQAAQKAVYALSILLPVLVFDFTMGLVNREPEEAFTKSMPLPMLAPRPPHAPRVVWVVFDEFDQNLAFDVRPKDLEMPELDRLVGTSLYADHAVPTADWTVLALPSLLSGRNFSKAETKDARTLLVTPEGTSEKLNWGKQPNVFRAAREIGVNAEIIGWHHPYCRVLGDQVVSCFALPSSFSPIAAHANEDGIWKTAGYLFRLQIENLRDFFRRDKDSLSENLKDQYLREIQQKQYLEIRDRAYRAAVDPRIGLLVLHLPLPHPFALYNRRQKNFVLDDSLDYFDNLALVDRTVGELRLALEQARMWDDTALLITADHGIRPEAWRGKSEWTEQLECLTQGVHGKTVPFILKLAGSTEPVRFTRTFSNVVSGSLALAVLEHKVSTPAQAVAWLEDTLASRDTSDAGHFQTAESMR